MLDTDILVDLKRNYPPARGWLASLVVPPSISAFSVIELLSGCRDMVDRREALALLSLFPVLDPTAWEWIRQGNLPGSGDRMGWMHSTR